MIQLTVGLGVVGVWYLTALNLSWIATIVALATVLPTVAVGVRRLHDIDRTGWWKLLNFVPVLGPVTLVVFYCLPGSSSDNRFGERPKGIGQDADPSPEQAEKELEKAVDKLKQACVESLASEKQLEAELQKANKELANWESRAAMAVNKNDDNLARQCLAKKLETNLAVQAFTAQLQAQKEASVSLKAKYADMQEQLRVFRLRKESLHARSQAASAQEASNKASSNNTASAMDRFEEKLRATEARNEAHREMHQASSTARSFENTTDLELEDELAAMKRAFANKQDDK
jgi:phage shock protein A